MARCPVLEARWSEVVIVVVLPWSDMLTVSRNYDLLAWWTTCCQQPLHGIATLWYFLTTDVSIYMPISRLSFVETSINQDNITLNTWLSFNPLETRGNYSTTSDNMKFVHWWWVGCCIVQQGGDLAGPSPLRPFLTVPNVTARPSTASVPNTILLYSGPLLCGSNVPIKG